MVSNPGNKVKTEAINGVILRLLGLNPGVELDYQTYNDIIKKKLVISNIAGGSLPREEEEILREELKRVRRIKDKGLRFKIKTSKAKVSTGTGPSVGGASPKTGAIVKAKTAKIVPQKIIPVNVKDITEKKEAAVGSFDEIKKTLNSILSVLASKFKFDKKQSDLERREKETEKRGKRESGLEGFKKGISAISGAAKKMLAPFQSIIDRIWRFIFFTLLGRAFTQLMEWLGDPKNKRKIEVLGRFLKDWWPSLAFAAGLFLTPFGGFVRTTIGLVRTFIPQLIKLTTNPAFLAIAGATAGGIAGASLESNIRKVDEKLLQRRIKEAEDKGKPLSKQEIEKIKLDQLQKRIQDVSGTNLPGSALLASGGLVPRFSGGGINPAGNYLSGLFDTGYEGIDRNTGQKVSGFGPDTQAIIAQPGEIVINKPTVDAVGAEPFLALNRQYGGPGANKPKMGRLYNTGGMVGGNAKIQNPKISPADYHSLLAIASLEDINPQGRADVAQSLYNRMFAAQKYNMNFNQRSSTLKDIITAGGGRTTGGQYAPTFDNKSDWLNIKDKMSAAIAVMNSEKGKKYKWSIKDAMEQLDSTESALKNPALQLAAQKHVGGRTYFLGTSQQKNMKPGDVLRSPEQNFFSPWFTEGTTYDKQRRNIAAPIPEILLPKKTDPKVNQQRLIDKRPWWDKFGWFGGASRQIQRKQGGGLINLESRIDRMINQGLPQTLMDYNQQIEQGQSQPIDPKTFQQELEKQKYNTKMRLLRNYLLQQQSIPKKIGGGISGLVKENTGFNIAGATADRQRVDLQPGEYVLTRDFVDRVGVPALDKLVAYFDSNSNPAKLGVKSKNIPNITPLPRGGSSGMMTLPPIIQSASEIGNIGNSSGAGSRAPVFSTVSASGARQIAETASILGIVG